MSDLDQHLSEARMANVPVRVSVELGRFEASLADTVSMPSGRTVPLDQGLADPVGVYVDGLLYARGQLVSAGGRWSVEIKEIMVDSRPEYLKEIAEGSATEVADLEQ